ncbi:MAG: WD40 repeat domain-containing protein [Nostoc sp. DedQUE05]|uniref:WD40 repeat domain-containing protein n=1 Tax=Nostoc sp. DedQUE05 TaxID=3075391 RepID=UPI002AD4AA06|nr:WD40 repeat domain-containing protein [Nostoc sp. DedQUE05]MDZ8094123.1 WD40 repeat domain-containing protein [Nostoc sp. DedQUE05]
MMPNNPNQPQEYDAVLGGQAPPPVSGVVLGGIEGVKRRLLSNNLEAKMAALTEAINYGDAGLELVIQSLQNESVQLKAVAYKLLHKRKEAGVEQVIAAFNPYHYKFFECLTTLTGHTSDVYGIAFSPNGQTIASGSHDKTIKLWNIQTSQLISTLGEGLSSLYALAFSPDGKTLYSNNWNEIKIWNLQNQQEIRTLKGHFDAVLSLAVAPDGTLISGSQDKLIYVWEQPRSGKYDVLGEHPCYVWGMNTVKVSLSIDGKILISGSAIDRAIKVWNWKQRQQITTLGNETLGLNNYVPGLSCVAISPDGTIAIAGGENQVDVWDIEKREKIYTLTLEADNKIHSISVSKDGEAFFGGLNNGIIKIWNLLTGEEIQDLEGHSANVMSIAVSPDGKTVVSGSIDRTIKIWGIPE